MYRSKEPEPSGRVFTVLRLQNAPRNFFDLYFGKLIRGERQDPMWLSCNFLKTARGSCPSLISIFERKRM